MHASGEVERWWRGRDDKGGHSVSGCAGPSRQERRVPGRVTLPWLYFHSLLLPYDSVPVKLPCVASQRNLFLAYRKMNTSDVIYRLALVLLQSFGNIFQTHISEATKK